MHSVQHIRRSSVSTDFNWSGDSKVLTEDLVSFLALHKYVCQIFPSSLDNWSITPILLLNWGNQRCWAESLAQSRMNFPLNNRILVVRIGAKPRITIKLQFVFCRNSMPAVVFCQLTFRRFSEETPLHFTRVLPNYKLMHLYSYFNFGAIVWYCKEEPFEVCLRRKNKIRMFEWEKLPVIHSAINNP